MAVTKSVRSACRLCMGGCTLLISLENGNPVRIDGHPDGPSNKGSLCSIGQASLDLLSHPDRLTHPLKRVGKRGEGKWRQITWDEALDLTAEGLNKIKKNHGPESVVMVHGSAKAFIDTLLVRLANTFGTPNVANSDYVCHVPKVLAAEYTFGFFPAAEFHFPPACIITWGVNKAETRFFVNEAIKQAQAKGSRLIAIDPMKTPHAKSADLFLQVRPGTDCALALGMINVIISENLYDEEFVKNWTIGFNRLKAHVHAYSPAQVAEITWVPKKMIVEAARMYATYRPGRIEWGNALDQYTNSFSALRAIAILMVLTGNIDVPGGEIKSNGSGIRYGDPESSGNGMRGRWSSELEFRDQLSLEERKTKVDPDLLPDFRYVTPQTIVKCVLEGKPYQIHGAFVQACNPLSSWPNIQKTHRAFKKLDFLAVSEMFMTPTAYLADVIFPVASYLEYDGINLPPGGPVGQHQAKVAQVGECRSDIEIILELATKLDLGDYFWDSAEGFWNYVLEPTGLTFKDLEKIKIFTGKKKTRTYKNYELEGFNTPTGKAEIYSRQLEAWGFDPLPVYREPPESPLSDADLTKEYPLICSCRKVSCYRHSEYRQIPALREYHPDPIMIIHPQTAGEIGIKDGDWAYIENKRGRIEQKASLSKDVDPRVIIIDIGWWFPEKGQEDLFGWAESNMNVLTNDHPPFNPEVGSFNIRGFACKVYRANT